MSQLDFSNSTTGDPTYMGDCPRCGFPTWLGISHFCPTAPKPQTIWTYTLIRLLLIVTLLASPAVAQDVTFTVYSDGPVIAGGSEEILYPAQEPSRDSQLLDFYRLRIANLERQVQVYEANDAEQRRIIASQKATIQASSGKVSTWDKWKLALTIAGSVAAIVGTAVGR